MKKEYINAQIEFFRFTHEDVLTSSSSTTNESEKENQYVAAGDLFTEPTGGGWF